MPKRKSAGRRGARGTTGVKGLRSIVGKNSLDSFPRARTAEQKSTLRTGVAKINRRTLLGSSVTKAQLDRALRGASRRRG